jgi:hypothetical protein
MAIFDLLPERFRQISISPRELVVPVADAFEAIDLLESKGAFILGWEGWVKYPDGRMGHGSAPQGTCSLETLSLQESAEQCRQTIRVDAARWEKNDRGTNEKLHICITVRV